ncbi:hypothetical protein, partial [Burkholderia pseudomallei]|uniref:hypothetical protein n=1 Tax=Burkholderia pseudomallei TaxID=28450 RepID=UPI001C4D1D29
MANAIIATNAPSHDHSSQHLHRRRSRSTPRMADSHRPHRRPAPRSPGIDLGQRHHRDERA